MSVNLPKVGEPLQYNYSYDLLNRIIGMQTIRNLNVATNNWTPVAVSDFGETVTYDPNGNILHYNRNGNATWAGQSLNMDQMQYNYLAGSNKLDNIKDDADPAAYTEDIDSQADGNYDYDAIGNLVKDQQSSIDDIKWTVYGKISDIHKTTGTATTIHYKYDGSGNRISKTVNGVLTWYVRDATGNVMSIYTRGDNSVNTGHLTQIETDIYGSSRLGIDEIKKDMEEAGTTDNGVLFNFQRGEKVYELGNHLGNVLSTIGDAKLPGSSNGNEVVDYTPKVQSAGDYYPFGMQEPGRTFSNMGYRYGFNGKENDNEVKGEGDQQDYGFRIYDPRLVRFLSEDPITQKYPELTPYQFASNSPIAGVDEDGLEWAYYDKDNKQVNINNSTTKEDKLKISGVRWSGYDVDAKGNKTAKAGTVATAFTFGKEGVTVSYLNSKGEGVQGWVGYKDLSTGNKNTDTKIGTLHPLVQNDMKSFVLMSKIRFGIDLRVTDGFRTVEQQDKLYAQGRTTKGNIVTKARGGFSNHNFGLAVDVVPYENGNLNWNTKYYPLIGLIGEGRGLEWGHRWKKIDDKPHFQNLQGQTLKQLRALPKNEKGLPIIQ